MNILIRGSIRESILAHPRRSAKKLGGWLKERRISLERGTLNANKLPERTKETERGREGKEEKKQREGRRKKENSTNEAPITSKPVPLYHRPRNTKELAEQEEEEEVDGWIDGWMDSGVVEGRKIVDPPAWYFYTTSIPDQDRHRVKKGRKKEKLQ